MSINDIFILTINKNEDIIQTTIPNRELLNNSSHVWERNMEVPCMKKVIAMVVGTDNS